MPSAEKLDYYHIYARQSGRIYSRLVCWLSIMEEVRNILDQDLLPEHGKHDSEHIQERLKLLRARSEEGCRS